MKNKKTIYILLPAVIGIWALIGFKIFNFKNDDNKTFATLENENNGNNQDSLNENYTLLLNYPDPFLKKRSYSVVNSNTSLNKTNSKKTIQRKSNIEQSKTNSDWPEIEYLGRVINQHDSRELAFVKIDKREKLIEPGSIINEVKILTIENKKITVEFNNEKREIFKKKS